MVEIPDREEGQALILISTFRMDDYRHARGFEFTIDSIPCYGFKNRYSKPTMIFKTSGMDD
jgi:hypothetical protein